MKSLFFNKIFLIIFVFILNFSAVQAQLVPRKVIAIYKISEDVPGLKWSNIHRYAEMPLNYLGLDIEYYDIDNGLPENINKRGDVRGVITWFNSGVIIDKPYEYLKWAGDIINSGKKFVIMGNPGFLVDSHLRSVSTTKMNRFWRKLGLKFTGNWIESTYDVDLIDKDPEIIDFERKYPQNKPAYIDMVAINPQTITHLAVKKRSNGQVPAQLIATSKNGGYIAEGYACNIDYNDKKPESLQWYINPFIFFQLAFDTEQVPKPDVTTIAGRRIYFSHIDGDGWLSQSKIEEYIGNSILCSRIILEKAIKAYPDLPVTVGPVVAELDLNHKGTETARKVAKDLFLLPNVEIGAHTYTHPYSWDFFENYNRKKELYKSSWFYKIKKELTGDNDSGNLSIYQQEGYDSPRAYDQYPFNLKQEVVGAIKHLEGVSTENKKGKIILWSGSCTPFEEAVRLTRVNNIRNINGGDSRFDRIFPSYAWVSSIGRHVGSERQIYAAASNENTYTNLWTSDFFGYKYLVDTFKNTESPIRIKPMNIYYHMYSGEKDASLEALISNLEYARNHEIAPITASNYSDIADGFYTTEIFKKGKNKWLFKNRGELQTIRFADAVFKTVDFKSSKGIIGQRHFQDSLYVYLDTSVSEPIIALKSTNIYWEEPFSLVPYLIEGRWKVWNLQKNNSGFNFTCQGFGKGRMSWKVPFNGNCKVIVNGKSYDYISSEHKLNLLLEYDAVDSIQVKVEFSKA